MSYDVMATAAEARPVAPASESWQALPTRGGRLAMLVGALTALIPVLPISFVLHQVLRHGPISAWWVVLLVLLIVPAIGAWLARRRWQRTSWRLDDQGFQVRRGVLWRDEILIPRSRVQHLDIERGPLERRFGLATLIVHTAGTRQHALRQSGLDDADAVALRDALVPAASAHDDAL